MKLKIGIIGSVLILICFFAAACKKKTAHFIIKGTVTDQTFHVPLNGAVVELYKVAAGGFNEEFVSSLTTGSDGGYSFDVVRDKTSLYRVKIVKANYFDVLGEINFSDLSVENDNIYNYSTTAKSWVKLHFKNNQGQPTDELTLTYQEGKTGCSECCSGGEATFSGAIDTSFYCINDGNASYSYLYFVLGTSNSGIKSVMTVPFDTVELLLEY